MGRIKRSWFGEALFLSLLAAGTLAYGGEKSAGLYWFVPDGTRADIGGKSVFELAEEGKLPNILKMMRNGAYGYSVPVYPSHTLGEITTAQFRRPHHITAEQWQAPR